MHHVALDRAGPDNRHFDDEIVKLPRLEARQHAHLGAALDLKHAERVGAAQHVVDLRLFLGDGGEREALRERRRIVLLDQLERLADAGQHPESQHVDLQDVERVEIVLVPFDEGAVRHRAIADRHDFVEPAAGDDEAADMLRQVAGKAVDLTRQLRDCLHARAVHIEPAADNGVLRNGAATHAPDRRGQGADRVFAQAENLADFADRGTAAIGDDGRGNAGAFTAVFFVDVLDHLFAALVLEIDVDVGRLVARGRDETLEQQADVFGVGIDFGDAKAEADR